MTRFLLFFSYIGSGFRGIQRQVPRYLETENPVPTVAESIESCLKKVLGLKKFPVLKTASRTDAGVHALRSAADIVLEVPPSVAGSLVVACNNHFGSIFCPIRIISCQHVRDDFDSRYYAVQRSYLYRFAVRKQNNSFNAVPRNARNYVPIPITEYLRCHVISNPNFNIDAVNQVLPLFRGVNDFRTFMGKFTKDKRNQLGSEEDYLTVRKLNHIDIAPGKPFLQSPLDNQLDYWDLTCSSKSFLYKQVRRMTAAIWKVGDGTLNYNDIKFMFDNPSKSSWLPGITSAPPYGLYLTDVTFNDEDLIEPIIEDIKPTTKFESSPKEVLGLSIHEKINLRSKRIQLENKKKEE